VSNQTSLILDKAFNRRRKYNIITFDTHERFQSELAKTGHDFYAFRYQGCKVWNETFAKMPENYFVLPNETVVNGINFDFILSQSKFGQLQMAKQIQNYFRIPIISVEHTVPTKDLSPQQVNSMRSLRGDINIFITEYARSQWGYDGEIVENSIDYDTFKPTCGEAEEKYILTVANDFVKRDYCLNYKGWKRIVENLPTRLVGDTPELSKPAASTDELVEEYNKCSLYLNTSTESQLPTVLLEAMACGKPVVSTATCSIPSFVKHGENGFLSNDEKELRKYVELLLNNKELREKMGNKAREMITKRFSHEKFINSWNKVFDKAYGV
jgi:glycosyltransferase involved in cell wall biosynthesis